MSQYLFSYTTFHGTHVNEKYPDPVTKDHTKMVEASCEEAAKDKLKIFIAKNEYNIDHIICFQSSRDALDKTFQSIRSESI